MSKKRADQTLPPPGPTPEHWEGVIAGLGRDREAATAELAKVVAERRGLAVAATGGDPEAAGRVVALNLRHAELVDRLDLIAMAAHDAGEKLGEALECRQRERAVIRKGEAVEVAKALLAQSERADGAMRELVSALGMRAALARRLAGLDENVSLKHLTNRTMLRAAAGHHGMSAVLEIGRGPRHLEQSLATTDGKQLGAVLAPPAPAEDPAEIAA